MSLLFTISHFPGHLRNFTLPLIFRDTRLLDVMELGMLFPHMHQARVEVKLTSRCGLPTTLCGAAVDRAINSISELDLCSYVKMLWNISHKAHDCSLRSPNPWPSSSRRPRVEDLDWNVCDTGTTTNWALGIAFCSFQIVGNLFHFFFCLSAFVDLLFP